MDGSKGRVDVPWASGGEDGLTRELDAFERDGRGKGGAVG